MKTKTLLKLSLVLLFYLSLSLSSISRLSLAAVNPINHFSWPYKGLSPEKDNTDSAYTARDYCSRSYGRSFKMNHKFSFRLSGIVAYVNTPETKAGEASFRPDLFRLSLLDYNGQTLVKQASPSVSAIILRRSSNVTFQLGFLFESEISGGVPYTVVLECLTDEKELFAVPESYHVTDGKAQAYDSLTGQTSDLPPYPNGRQALFTSLIANGAPHFPPITITPTPVAVKEPPKYHPVILVHGLGGTPGAFDGSEDPQRNYVKLLTDLGYPSDYIHPYSYGYKDDGRGSRYYNYQGDVREIASGLETVVKALSERHKAEGGDGKVDVVAHSLGNLVTRYYLMKHKDNHKIRRYVAIAAPFKGSWVMGVDKGIRSMPILGSFIESLMANSILTAYNKDKVNKLAKDSIASIQASPRSDFFEGNDGINKTIINQLDLFTVYGDISATIRQKLFTKTFERKISLGDGLILPDSASFSAWNSNSAKKFVYNDGVLMDVKFNRTSNALAAELQLDNPKSIETFHTDLLTRNDSQGKILCLISSESTSSCDK